MIETKKGHCDCCGKEIKIPKSALNKRFCSLKCKNEWHAMRRREAFALLEQQEKRK